MKIKQIKQIEQRERYKPLYEGKVTSFDISKLEYFSLKSILNLLNSSEFKNKRVTYDSDRNIIGGTQKATKEFISVLIKKDMEATKELELEINSDQKKDYNYLKSIK